MIDTFLACLMIAAILAGGICMLAEWPFALWKGWNSTACHRLQAAQRWCGMVLIAYFFGKLAILLFAWLFGHPIALWLIAAFAGFVLAIGLLRLAVHLGMTGRLLGVARVVVPFILVVAATSIAGTAAGVASWATMA